MAKTMYTVVGGSTKKVKSAYCVVGGVTKKLKAVYTVVGGSTKLVWTSRPDIYAFGGVSYSQKTTGNNYYTYVNSRTWDGETFSSPQQYLLDNQSSNAFDRQTGAFISKGGKLVCSWTSMNTEDPTLKFSLWNKSASKYELAYSVRLGTLFTTQTNNSYWDCYIADKAWLSADSTKAVFGVYFSATSSTYYNSSYTSYFDSYKKSPANYLLFFDIDPDKRTVKFVKGCYVRGPESHDLPTSSPFNFNKYNFSENDDFIICTTFSDYDSSDDDPYYYKRTTFYKIDPINNTATQIRYGAPSYFSPAILSSDGHYVTGWEYDSYYDEELEDYDYNSYDRMYYITDSAITSMTRPSDIGNSRSDYILNNMYYDATTNLYYASDGYYIDTFSINGTTATKIGSYSIRNFMSRPVIHDISDLFILCSGSYSGGNRTLDSTLVGVMSRNSSGVITSIATSFSEQNYSQSRYAYNGAKLLDKEGLVAKSVGTNIVKTSSSTWTVPAGVTSIDIFCAGGGGGAGGSSYYWDQSGTTEDGRSIYEASSCDGSAGAGGYTSTVKKIAVTPGEILTITIGAGGGGGAGYYYYDGQTNGVSTSQISSGGKGGTSSVTRSDGTVLCTANGGNGGNATRFRGDSGALGTCTDGVSGGSGSGGTCPFKWGYDTTNGSINFSGSYGNNGTDGSNGTSASCWWGVTQSGGSGGTGQGSTTREWGSALKTLYSSAGANSATSPVANTGHGGVRDTLSEKTKTQASGSSGIVIIRY